MSGIINYYHGESGVVEDCWWGLSGEFLAYHIQLAGDPHRSWAWDYGADIGIDPAIQPGDEAVYWRLEDAAGIWVSVRPESATELQEAIDRVQENRRLVRAWKVAKSPEEYTAVGQEIFESTGQPLRVMTLEESSGALAVVAAGWAILAYGPVPRERPNASASFFLSHAAEDTMLARHISEELKAEANANVWLDLAQPKEEVLDSDARIAEWLQRSIHAASGFVVLWTEHAGNSSWVKRELLWAREQRLTRTNFHIIVLKLREVAIPAEGSADSHVIDCNDIWWSNGLSEELYAAIFRRQSRRAWLATLPAGAPVHMGTTIGYRDFESDSGTVVRFDWAAHPDPSTTPARNDIHWQLEYARRSGEQRRVTGGGEEEPADLGMRPGDRVGYFKVRWRHGSHVLSGPGLWMRSAALDVTSDTVLDQYFATLHGER
ncbi:MAG: toll/interleukin-1 receptor domain-containing protein [Burkholderiales bacterium]